jgi:hypothetical protein
MLFFEDEGAPEYHRSEHHRAWKHQRSNLLDLRNDKGRAIARTPLFCSRCRQLAKAARQALVQLTTLLATDERELSAPAELTALTAK